MNPSRRSSAAGLVLVLMAGLWPAWAGAASLTPDSPHAFAEAQIAGKPIVVFVHAAWCITCRRQQPVLEMLTKEPAFANVLVLVVNYDKDKDTLRALGVADPEHPDRLQRHDGTHALELRHRAAAIRSLFERAL